VIPFRSMLLRSLLIRTLALLFVLGCVASAQTSITVAVAPSAVNWPSLIPGSATNAGSASITLTTSWSLTPAGGGDNLKVYVYFTSATVALAHSAVCSGSCPDIPSSAFQVRVNGGALTAVTGTGPFGAAGASLQVAAVPVTGANKNSSRTDTLQFNINLSALPNLPADSYSGVLNIQAQSLP
jgi:hypothetical protein